MVRSPVVTEPTEVEPGRSYHKQDGNGMGRDRDRKREQLRERYESRRFIAWDGEGIDLSGPNMPQHYVLFGCSAEPDSPLMIDNPTGNLDFIEIARYICDVGSRYPDAKHIGYSFAYDQNMIIRSLSAGLKERIYDGQSVYVADGADRYRVKIIPRKRIEFTRYRPHTGKVSVRIDDIFSFFGSSFVKAYESLNPECTDDREWATVVDGKARRSDTRYVDLGMVREYWHAEIRFVEDLARRFRDIVYGGGFYINDWYGPGVLANYVRREHRLAAHEWGGKESNIPPGAHHASKSAFYGGRFEQFACGRVVGRVYGLDLNSAYPAAFCHVPSLAEGGFWNHVEQPSDSPATFGVYKIRYSDPAHTAEGWGTPIPSGPIQPLPHRDADGRISYPGVTEGWYWRPEVDAVRDLYPGRVQVFEGWEWVPVPSSGYPWRDFMSSMFEKRLWLKQQRNPVQMSYKLAMNSLYGKEAQRVGWNKEKKTPPKAHTLAIAGFVTSWCRAQILRVASSLRPDQLIAIETDGIYTTADPAALNLQLGENLGEWELSEYDEIMYLQSGVYAARQGDQWLTVKTRGMSAATVDPVAMGSYLLSLPPGDIWPEFTASEDGRQFVTLGAALNRSRGSGGVVIPSRLSAVHCAWLPDVKTLAPGNKGKRRHMPINCRACDGGLTAWESIHSLCSYHGTPEPLRALLLDEDYDEDNYRYDPTSHPHILPWETDKVETWRDISETELESGQADLWAHASALPRKERLTVT